MTSSGCASGHLLILASDEEVARQVEAERVQQRCISTAHLYWDESGRRRVIEGRRDGGHETDDGEVRRRAEQSRAEQSRAKMLMLR